MIDLQRRPCEVCGHVDSELLWTTTWPEHGYPGDFSMRRCRACGLLFNSPRLDDGELGRLYGRNYYFFSRSDAAEIARIIPMYRRTVGLVVDQISDQRCLDIGCGRGYLPAVLKRLGWDAHGVEISSDAAEYARRTFDLDVFTGTIEHYANSNSRRDFPLLSAIDVIEHVPSPRTFIEAIAQVIEPGGRLILDTPNSAARNITTKGLNWPGFNPFHIFLFDITNLTTLLNRSGLTVERAFSYNNRCSAGSLRDTMHSVLKSAGLIRPAARLYFKLKGMAPNRGTAMQHVERAVGKIKSMPAWSETPDASAPLAAGKAGDNIVVIARRR